MSPVTVLALLTSPRDRHAVKNIISHSNWDLRFAANVDEAKAALRDHGIGVVISDGHLFDGECWEDVLAALQTLPVPPTLVVVDTGVPARISAELLNIGAYDLITKPLDSAEVVRTVSAAWLSWKQRLENAARVRKPVSSAGNREAEPEGLTKIVS